MFETSVVRARVAERRFSLLSVSVVAHSLVIVAVLAASIASVSFPKAPPHEYTLFFQQAAPPPPPAAPRQVTPQPPQAHPAAGSTPVIPHLATIPLDVTPSRIPLTIPSVQPPSGNPGTAISNGPANGGTSNVGDANSVGSDDSVGDTTPVPDTVFHPGAEVKPAVVIYRVEPAYPRAALVARMPGTVVLKCIIDKSGNVRDAEVVTSSFAAFNQPALDALQHWRFAPGSFRGKAVDTWFELTIRFQAR